MSGNSSDFLVRNTDELSPHSILVTTVLQELRSAVSKNDKGIAVGTHHELHLSLVGNCMDEAAEDSPTVIPLSSLFKSISTDT